MLYICYKDNDLRAVVDVIFINFLPLSFPEHVFNMTYTVSSGTLNTTVLYNTQTHAGLCCAYQ